MQPPSHPWSSGTMAISPSDLYNQQPGEVGLKQQGRLNCKQSKGERKKEGVLYLSEALDRDSGQGDLRMDHCYETDERAIDFSVYACTENFKLG